MKNKNLIELKYHKNSKQEIVFENLNEIKENDNVVLRLKDGDLTPIFSVNPLLIPENIKLFIPALKDINIIDRAILHLTDDRYDTDILYTFDVDGDLEQNILPKWNIPEDSAVLFLNMSDFDKYAKDYDDYFTYPNLENEDDLPQNCYNIGNYKYISIIATSIHAEDKSCPYHIDNINKIAKELKEKHGIERIQLFVSHCFVKRKYEYIRCPYSSYELDYKFDNWNKYDFDLKKNYTNQPIQRNSFIPIIRETIVNDDTTELKVEKEYELTKSIKCKEDCKCTRMELPTVGLMTIDNFNPLHDGGEEYNYGDYIHKITTTNSTGILEVQKSERLEVVDCVEFFKHQEN